MTQILAFGTIWFWILITVISGIIIWITEEENDGIWSSNIWFFGTLVALYFLGNSESFNEIGTYIIQNPGVAIGIFAAYILLGSIWSIVKWFFYLKRIKAKHQEYSFYSFDMNDYKIGRNKERVLHWMIYWPLSSVWTLINDPVKKAFEFVLSQFGGFYDKMSEKILGDIAKKKEEQKENNGKK
jgi:hypothetical protein